MKNKVILALLIAVTAAIPIKEFDMGNNLETANLNDEFFVKSNFEQNQKHQIFKITGESNSHSVKIVKTLSIKISNEQMDPLLILPLPK